MAGLFNVCEINEEKRDKINVLCKYGKACRYIISGFNIKCFCKFIHSPQNMRPVADKLLNEYNTSRKLDENDIITLKIQSLDAALTEHVYEINCYDKLKNKHIEIHQNQHQHYLQKKQYAELAIKKAAEEKILQEELERHFKEERKKNRLLAVKEEEKKAQSDIYKLETMMKLIEQIDLLAKELSGKKNKTLMIKTKYLAINTYDFYMDSLPKEECTCCSALIKQKDVTVCGNKGCVAKLCDICCTGHYGKVKPGGIVTMNMLDCPYCKRRATETTYSKWCDGGLINFDMMKDEHYYALCKECGKTSYYSDKQCADMSSPNTQHYVCIECLPDAFFVDCPRCNVKIEKEDGCNKLHCTLCDAFFCFLCHDKVYDTEKETYDHLTENHGGFY